MDLEPLSFTPFPSTDLIPDRCGQGHRALFSPAPSCKAFFLGGAGCQRFSSGPSHLLLRLSFRQGELQGGAFVLPPLLGWGLHLACGATKTTEVPTALTPAHRVGMLCQERQTQETWGCHSEGSSSSAPTPHAGAVALRFFPGGEVNHRIEGSRSLPNGVDFSQEEQSGGQKKNLKYLLQELSLQRSPNLTESVCIAIYVPGNY